ncbi:MAG: DUF2254 domain-containing protein [Clostridiales bacterium]|nr:DUF2254 domain-containing protein [Clostridiales bacterium]
MEGVLFNSPIILGGFALALTILIFELRTNSTGYFLPVLSVLLSIAVIIYAILLGATLQEIVIVLLLFVIINLAGLKTEKPQLSDEKDNNKKISEEKSQNVEDKK